MKHPNDIVAVVFLIGAIVQTVLSLRTFFKHRWFKGDWEILVLGLFFVALFLCVALAVHFVGSTP